MAFVASGEDFPDGLAVGPVAADLGWPIYLTPRDHLHEAAADELPAFTDVYIVGGANAVSEAVANEIRALEDDFGGHPRVSRIGGRDRTETATLIADWWLEQIHLSDHDFQFDHVNLARGDVFADAVAGAPHGAVERAPIVLTVDPNTLGAHTRCSYVKAAAMAVSTLASRSVR